MNDLVKKIRYIPIIPKFKPLQDIDDVCDHEPNYRELEHDNNEREEYWAKYEADNQE